VIPARGAATPGPRIVCIGGGHGMAQVLRAVRGYAGSIDAVVTVSDDGGSSGRLAPELDIPPPGDIRRCLLALTPADSPWRRLFEYRFAGADVSGHSLGNLIIAALADIEADFEGGLARAARLLESIGSVIPAAPVHLRLAATIDGRRVDGQHSITTSRGRISALAVSPSGIEASPRALAAIGAADQIVLGPGSLYTSLIATLIVPGIAAAITASPATFVYVANLITQDGETIGVDAAAHLAALRQLAGVRAPDAIVAASGAVYAAPPLEPLRWDAAALEAQGIEFVLADVADPDAPWPQHDPVRLGRVLAGLAIGRSEQPIHTTGGTPP